MSSGLVLCYNINAAQNSERNKLQFGRRRLRTIPNPLLRRNTIAVQACNGTSSTTLLLPMQDRYEFPEVQKLVAN